METPLKIVPVIRVAEQTIVVCQYADAWRACPEQHIDHDDIGVFCDDASEALFAAWSYAQALADIELLDNRATEFVALLAPDEYAGAVND